MDDEKCVFCAVINGEVPKYLLHEDDLTMTILSIGPFADGHALVIPKTHSDYLWDAGESDYEAIHAAARKVAVVLQEALGVERVLSMVDGTEVTHTHLHLIPSDFSLTTLIENHQGFEPDHDRLAELADRISAELT